MQKFCRRTIRNVTQTKYVTKITFALNSVHNLFEIKASKPSIKTVYPMELLYDNIACRCDYTRLYIFQGGNQRELSRVKAEKRKEKYAKEGNKDYNKKKERDADVMRDKQRIAEEKKVAEAAAARAAGASVKRPLDPLKNPLNNGAKAN